MNKKFYLLVIIGLLLLPGVLAGSYSDDFSLNTSEDFRLRLTDWNTTGEMDGWTGSDVFDGYIMTKPEKLNLSAGDYILVNFSIKSYGSEFTGPFVRGGYKTTTTDMISGYVLACRSGSWWFLNAAVAWVLDSGVSCTTNTNYSARVQWTGSRFQARVWSMGTAEPSTWTIDHAYTTATQNPNEDYLAGMVSEAANAGFQLYDLASNGNTPGSPSIFVVRLNNSVDGSLVSGFCANLSQGESTVLYACNSSGTDIPYNVSGTYNVSFSNVTNGHDSPVFFNASITNIEVNLNDEVYGLTSQALLSVNTTQLYTQNPISAFNATNDQAQNTTTTGSLTLPALNGTNTITIDTPGNYSVSGECLVPQPLQTVSCTIGGVYDNKYTITARDGVNASTINTFTLSVNQTSIGLLNTTNTTTGSIILRLLQGYEYTINVSSDVYANTNTTLPANASTHSYEFTLFPANHLNITFTDEQTGSVLNNKTVTLNLISTSDTRTLQTTTGNLSVEVTSMENYTLQYSAQGYYTRTYTVTPMNDYLNLVLPLLDTTNGTSVTITVKDSLGSPVEGALVRVHKLDLTTGNYVLIETSATNFEGQTLVSLVLNDPFYKFFVENDGTVVLTSQPTQVFTNTLTLIVNLIQGSGLNEILTDFTLSGDVTYDNTTREFTYEYNDQSNSLTQSCLVIRTLGDTRTEYARSCSTSGSGTITLSVVNTSGVIYEASGTIIDSRGVTHNMGSLIVSFEEGIPESGSGLLMMVFMIIAFVAALAVNVELAVIMTGFVPLMFVKMGLVNLGLTPVIGLAVLGVVLAGIMGVVKR